MRAKKTSEVHNVALPEEADGSLDATEVATAIVFYRTHRFKERYSYAAHIADELRRFAASAYQSALEDAVKLLETIDEIDKKKKRRKKS